MAQYLDASLRHARVFRVDLYVSNMAKETYVREKRPMYMKRDLYNSAVSLHRPPPCPRLQSTAVHMSNMANETYLHENKPTCIKRDLINNLLYRLDLYNRLVYRSHIK